MGIKKFKIAFVGSGYMNIEHIKTFKALKNKFSIAGIISRKNITAKKIAKRFKIKHLCTSIEELYLSTKADLVVIAVSENEVKKVCFEAFKYPWKIFVEKPIGKNLNEAQSIYNLAKKNRILKDVVIGLNRRNYTSTLETIKMLKSDNSKRYIQIFDQQDLDDPKVKKYPKSVRNNWMFKNPIHLIDYFKIFGRGNINLIKKFKIVKNNKLYILNAHIKFSSGDIGQYNSVWNMPGPWAVIVTTRHSRYEMRPLEILKYQKRGSRLFENLKINYNKDKKFKAGLYNQAHEIYSFLNKKKNNLVKIEESLFLMKLIDRIYT